MEIVTIDMANKLEMKLGEIAASLGVSNDDLVSLLVADQLTRPEGENARLLRFMRAASRLGTERVINLRYNPSTYKVYRI